MNTFFSNIRGMISDSTNGTISSKRIVVFLCVIMMVVGFVANVFYGAEVSEHIYTSIMMVVLVGVGLTGAEKFAKSAAPVACPVDESFECCRDSQCCRNVCCCCCPHRQGDTSDCCKLHSVDDYDTDERYDTDEVHTEAS